MRLQNTAVSIKDVCRLWTHPVVIGSGQRLVRAGNDISGPTLLDRQAYPEIRQPITALALAMLGVDTELQSFEYDRA